MACSVRLATSTDVTFIAECIKRGHTVNDHYFNFDEWVNEVVGLCSGFASSFDAVKMYLNPKYPNQDILIVNNGSEDVGFFSQDLDYQNMFVGGAAYVHPRACKMAILKVIKAVAIRGYIYGCKNDFEAIEFNIADPLVGMIVKSLIPHINEYRIRDDYRIFYGQLPPASDEAQSLADFYSSVKESHSVSVFDENNVLFTFNDRGR